MILESTEKYKYVRSHLQLWYQGKYDEELDLTSSSKQEAPQRLKQFFLEILQTTKENKGKESEPGTGEMRKTHLSIRAQDFEVAEYICSFWGLMVGF